MTTQKAQGTIEYLVIIAIVIVIALIVVGLLLQVMGQGSGIPDTAAKTAWKSAEPLALIDWSRSIDGNLTVVLKNNSSDTLTFIDMNLSTNPADGNAMVSSSIAPGATISKIITTTGACASGTKYIFKKADIHIDYNNVNIAAKIQPGVADIAGTC